MNCFSFIEFHPVSAVFNEGKLFHNIYDASGERTLKAQGEYQGLFENGVPTDGGVQLNAYTTYPSPYITISPKEVYTKHYFAGTQRVASKPEGKAGIFNTSPLHGYEELKIRQLGDAQAVADTVDLGIITLGGPIEEPVNPDVYYFHPDHLGTSTMISDGSGYAYQFFLNLPFGANERKSHAVFLEVCERSSMAEQRRGGSFDNPYKFNGKELDEETGLYYYGARYYNPRISVFMSVDPLAESTMTPYQYTYQNPINLVDPTGMVAEDPPNLYLIEKYRGTVLKYHHSNSNEIEIIGKKSSYFAKPYLDKNDNLVGFGIATEEGRLDYVISKSDFNDFTKGVDRYRHAADLFNANGPPSENMIAYSSAMLEGNYKGMMNAAFDMWKEPGAIRDALITTFMGVNARSMVRTNVRNTTNSVATPKGWIPQPSKKGGGIVFKDPSNPHNIIRQMPGNPNSPNVLQQNPYVKFMKEGTFYDVNGKALPNGNVPEAHIPLNQFNINNMPKF